MPEETGKPKKTQRNALRSEKMIRRAYLKLLSEKPYDEKITITEIVEEAEICRGTFYSHFSGIEDLTKLVRMEIMDKLKEIAMPVSLMDVLNHPEPVVRKIVEDLDIDRSYGKYLLTNAIAIQEAEKFMPMLIDGYVSELREIYRQYPQEEIRAALVFLVAGLCRLLISWLRDEVILPADSMVKVITQMIQQTTFSFSKEEE